MHETMQSFAGVQAFEYASITHFSLADKSRRGFALHAW
jgi:hypothetical protein